MKFCLISTTGSCEWAVTSSWVEGRAHRAPARTARTAPAKSQQKSPRILIKFHYIPSCFLLFSLFISETYEIQWPFSSFFTCFLPLLFRKNTKSMSCKTNFSCFSCFLLFSYLKNERKIFRSFELFAQISRLLTAPVFMISLTVTSKLL